MLLHFSRVCLTVVQMPVAGGQQQAQHQQRDMGAGGVGGAAAPVDDAAAAAGVGSAAGNQTSCSWGAKLRIAAVGALGQGGPRAGRLSGQDPQRSPAGFGAAARPGSCYGVGGPEG